MKRYSILLFLLCFSGILSYATAGTVISGFSVSPSSVSYGQTVTFGGTIASTGNTTITMTLSGPNGFNQQVYSETVNFGTFGSLNLNYLSMNMNVPTTGTYTFTINAGGQSANASVYVTVPTTIDLQGFDGRPNFPTMFFDIVEPSISWGKNMSVRFGVLNNGNGTAGSFKVKVYLSKNSTFGDSDDFLIYTYNFSSLPGGYFGFTGTNPGDYNLVTLPTSNPFGDSSTQFYVGMIVDADNQVAESNETNNKNLGVGIDFDSTPITITPPVPKAVFNDGVASMPPGTSFTTNFGDVVDDGAGGAQKIKTFTLVNGGDAPLNLTWISFQQGTAFRLTKVYSTIQTLSNPLTLPRVVASNSSEIWTFEVAFDPTALGSQTDQMIITSNDPVIPTATINLQGNGTPTPNILLSSSLLDFGKVINDATGGVSATQTFTIKNSGSGNLTIPQNGLTLTNSTGWSIQSIVSSIQGTISLSSGSKLIAAKNIETWTVTVKFDPTSFAYSTSGLQIASDDLDTPLATVSLQGTGAKAMSLTITDSIGSSTDKALAFGSVHADGTGKQLKTGTVTLQNSGDIGLTISQNGVVLTNATNFKITQIVSSTQGTLDLTTASKTIASGSTETWTISLQFDPTTSGALSSTLNILSDDPALATASVALSGTGLLEPDLQVVDSVADSADRTMDFSATLNDGAGNRVNTQTVTLKNIGANPLVMNVNGISLVSAAKFSISSIVSSTRGTINIASATTADRTIASAESELWTVTLLFDPTANQSETGTLKLQSNDPQEPTINLALSGKGVQPTITLQPTVAGSTLYLASGQIYPIRWTATDEAIGAIGNLSGDATINLYRDTDTDPASGLVSIASGLSMKAATQYDWRPESTLAGQTIRLYATITDGTIVKGSYAARAYYIDGATAFHLRSPLQTTSKDYAYEYDYNGKIYSGVATLVNGANTVSITVPIDGGVNAIYEFSVNKVDSLLAQENYTYDEMRRIKTMKNGNGIVTTYTYDLAGRLTRTEATNGNVVTYTYDNLGRRLSMLDSTGSTFYDYDDLDRLIGYTTSKNATKGDSDDLKIQYEYDNANRQKAIVYPGGERIEYGYDDAGRLKTVNNVTRSLVTTYEYSPTNGLLQKRKLPNSVWTDFGYDNMGRLNLIYHYKHNLVVADTLIAKYEYALNAGGNAELLTMTYPGSLVKKQKYTYDAADRIKEVIYSNDATIDAFDRKVTYDYDGVGNRLSQKIEENGVTLKDLRSSYGSENRLLAVTDQVTGNEVARYVYDAAGNRVQKVAAEGTTFYSYDERNLLTSLLTPQTYVSYEYNGSAHRIARTEGGIRNAYVVDPNRSVFEVIQERDNAGVIQKSYTFGLDRLWMQPTGGTLKYYLADRLGSVRQTVDSNANILETFDYDVFGMVRE